MSEATAPRVSVILPSYNVAEHLRTALPLLLQQTRRDIEIVVVDDGSADDSAAVAAQWQEKDDRVRAIALPENGGVAAAREHGVRHARGEYLWFVDADDGWPADAVETLLARAEEDDLDVVIAGAVFAYSSGSTRALSAPSGPAVDGPSAFRRLLRGRITGHLWNKLFRRTVMAQASFARARVQSDLIMVADALSRAGSVGFVDRQVYEYRLREGSVISTPTARAASLALIAESVAADVARLDLQDSAEWRYFRLRYIALSGMKDATSGPYDPAERAELVRRIRSGISAGDIAFLARAKDPSRLALAVAAKSSLPAYRALLRAADRAASAGT